MLEMYFNFVFVQQSLLIYIYNLWTSGILLCAKTRLARTQFAAYFADGTSCIRSNRLGNVPFEDFLSCLCMCMLYIQRMMSLFVLSIS